jgi:hypothetical protein
MSLFNGIQNIEHTFAGWAEKELSQLFNAAPKIEQVADAVLTYAGPALQTIVTLEAGAPAGVLVGKVIQEAQSDLTAASGVIYDFGPSPSAASLIDSVKANLSALLTAGHVTNSTSVSSVNQVISELDILVTALKKTTSAVSTDSAAARTGTAASSDPAAAGTNGAATPATPNQTRNQAAGAAPAAS